MAAVMPVPAASRILMSGNEAVARAVWEAGVKVAAAYPGTPSTEMLEVISTYPDLYAEWSVNEKVSLEVAIGAAYAGSRAFCCMKHVGMNVASDALMTLTLTGVIGGLVIAIADDVGLSSSQNEQDSRFWGRFAHVPVLEPADSQEAYAMTLDAYELSERFQVPVILRMTTRINHVKGLVTVGERREKASAGFRKDPARWVMTPTGAGKRIPLMFARVGELRKEAEVSALNFIEPGSDRRVGFIASGPAYMHVKESFPDAPVLKLGFSSPVPFEKCRDLAALVDQVVVALRRHAWGWLAGCVVAGLAATVKQPLALVVVGLAALATPSPPAGRGRWAGVLARPALGTAVAGGTFALVTWVTGLGYGWLAGSGSPSSVKTSAPASLLADVVSSLGGPGAAGAPDRTGR